MKDIHILHLLCKYLLGGQVTFGERAFGQILTLSDHPSLSSDLNLTADGLICDNICATDNVKIILATFAEPPGD